MRKTSAIPFEEIKLLVAMTKPSRQYSWQRRGKFQQILYIRSRLAAPLAYDRCSVHARQSALSWYHDDASGNAPTEVLIRPYNQPG